MKSQRRAVPATMVTHRDQSDQPIASSLPRADFDRLEAECRKRGITKSEFIRLAVQDALKSGA